TEPDLAYFLFFSTTRPPPSSTPFPYTTLFRSGKVVVPGTGERLRSKWTSDRAVAARWRREALNALELGLRPGDSGPNTTVAQAVDRKSTRLNSSHRTISYAVFCLKKKKNT